MGRKILLLVGSLTGTFLYAQTPHVIKQGAYWFRYYQTIQFNKKWILNFEADERRFVNPDRQAQFFSHLHIHRKILNTLDAALGFNMNLTNSNKNWSLVVPELRPWQEISWTKLFSNKIQFQFRYRLDHRFIHNNDKIKLIQGYGYNPRHRFRLQFNFPIKSVDNTALLTGRISDEIMLNSGNAIHTFDQNRLSISLDKRLNANFSLEIGYLYLFQSRTDSGFYGRHIVRTTLYHKINLSKNQDK